MVKFSAVYIVAIFLSIGWALTAGSFSAYAVQSPYLNRLKSDGNEVARSALAPYTVARSYRGVRTTTTVGDRGRCEMTVTVSIQAQCNAEGNVERYRTQSLCWGRRQGRDIGESGNVTAVMDGDVLWVMHPNEDRYQRAPAERFPLERLLGLPSPDASWSLVTKKHSDAPEERAVRSVQSNVEWTLITDSASGRLMRIESTLRIQGRRTKTTSVLKDIAFDGYIPNEHFAFTPPSWMNEDVSSVADTLP